jgi:hypothetical protein
VQIFKTDIYYYVGLARSGHLYVNYNFRADNRAPLVDNPASPEDYLISPDFQFSFVNI